MHAPVQAPGAGARHINPAGLAIIKGAEGLRLHAYLCPAGIPTIGWGHTAGVRIGDAITAARAEQLLAEDLHATEAGVARLAPTSTDNQFSALVSLAFNIGLGDLAGSTLLKLHRAGDYRAAKLQFARWNRAAGAPSAGLTARRTAEAALYGRP